MALLGKLVNSREEWNICYLRDLREKFLQQEYPLSLINEQFSRALSVDRADLLFRSADQKKTKKVIAPLVITYNPGNPFFKSWIKEEIKILHEDIKLKKLFPTIDVVTRQTANIKKRIMRNRYTSDDGNNNVVQPKPPGNFQYHDAKKCVCCSRMEDGLKKVKVSKTGREYQIKRHYTCLSTHVVYLATCGLCHSQYVGQTTMEMRKRHYGHRDEIKRQSDGIGEHFHHHAIEMGLDLKKSVDMDRLMNEFKLAVVGSVQPGMPWTQSRLDTLESDLQHRFQCLLKHGGIGKRDETRRRRNGQ